MDLNRIALFVRVVETSSFTAAARSLGLRKSSVSRGVSSLEEDLGVRLLHRTTRSLSLTDAGRVYFDRVREGLSFVTDATADAREMGQEPQGTVRVTAVPQLAEDVHRRHRRALRSSLPENPGRARAHLALDRSRRGEHRHRRARRTAPGLHARRPQDRAERSEPARVARVPASPRHAEDAARSRGARLPSLPARSGQEHLAPHRPEGRRERRGHRPHRRRRHAFSLPRRLGGRRHRPSPAHHAREGRRARRARPRPPRLRIERRRPLPRLPARAPPSDARALAAGLPATELTKFFDSLQRDPVFKARR